MNGLLLSLLAGILPMFLYAWFLYYLDRYEKEPFKLLLGTFLWGALIAAGGAFFINSISSRGIYIITQSEFATQLATSALIAPAVEETLKGTAVLIVFLLFRPEFDSPLDGIVYAGITALGFAATENVWYIHQFGYLASGYSGLADITLVRIVLVGWQHPFYTAFIGLGFALARESKTVIQRIGFPFLGWTFAVGFHTLHNLLAVLSAKLNRPGQLNLIWDWSGYIGLLILILLLIKREQKWMRYYLAGERDNGVLDNHHYQIATSAWRQGAATLRSLLKGNSKQVRRTYQVCGDLMHKLRQEYHQGTNPEVKSEIERLRSELVTLR